MKRPVKVSNSTLEMCRHAAKNNVEAYGFTIDSLEPDITFIDAGAYYASAGISLRRIADALENIAAEMKHNRLSKP